MFDLIEKHGIECEPVLAGTLHCAVGRGGLEEIEARAEQWQRRGAPVTVLDAEETRRKLGGGDYSGALLDRRAGTIQPLSYLRGLAQAALAAGVRIFTQSAVLTASDGGSRWKVDSTNGSVWADWVIVTTDAYARGPWSRVRQEQIHLPYFNFATHPLSDSHRASILPERQEAWDTKQVLSSFRFDRAGRLVFGSIGALEGTGAAVHRAWAIRSLRKLFPQLARVGFEAGWFGLTRYDLGQFAALSQAGSQFLCFSGYNGRSLAAFSHLMCLATLQKKTFRFQSLQLRSRFRCRVGGPLSHRLSSRSFDRGPAPLEQITGLSSIVMTSYRKAACPRAA
ncbi:NAD(P)/FAD-dependent oxidoreductase [Bradyrhizobium sp. Pha-3]|uniref:NAD(P)/FAD-dependent oxidoreductase n=1 Tax=Bradyrhizobium sp. Pha-3 TaxID=208375 RepID=UPI0035D4330C